MELTLSRQTYTEESTTGDLLVDGAHECFVCEDKYREPSGPKVFGKTAIPEGRFGVTIERSPRFSKMAGRDVFLPRLHDVPGFEGVLIHTGNTPEDTEGCLLVGCVLGVNRVDSSRVALANLQPKIQAAIDRGEKVFITVKRG